MYPTLIQSDDDELRRRILISLQARGVKGLDGVDLKVAGGIIRLSGHLDSSRDHYLLQECCRHVAGVLRLVEFVEIDPDGESTYEESEHSSSQELAHSFDVG